MTANIEKKDPLTDEEWLEFVALKDVINECPQCLSSDKMEVFTNYLVRSMREMGS